MVSPQNGYEDEDYGWNGQEGLEPDLEPMSEQYCSCHHEGSEPEGKDKEDKEDKEDKGDVEQYEKLSKCRFNVHGYGSPLVRIRCSRCRPCINLLTRQQPVVKPREYLGLFPTPPIVRRPREAQALRGAHSLPIPHPSLVYGLLTKF
jgi:hypothetical protein